MQTSETSNQSEDRGGGRQETHLGNDTKAQARRCLRIVVNGPEVKDVEIRNSEEGVGLDGDALMVTCIAEDVADEMGGDLSMAQGLFLEQRALQAKQQPRNKHK